MIPSFFRIPEYDIRRFLPNTGRAHNSSIESGTFPVLGDDDLACTQDTFAFASKKTGRANFTFERSRPCLGKSLRASGYFLNSAGVTMFTRLSVHCALKMVAIKSCNGFPKSSSQCASG